MRRLEGLAAIGFAVTYVVALVLTNVPDQGETRREAIDFYDSAGDKAKLLVSVALMAVAALLFGLFAAAAVERLRGIPRHLAGIAAGAFVALYLAAAAAFLAPTFTLSLDPDGANAVNRQFVDFARGTSTIGDALLLVCSLFSAAAFVGALAWSRSLPRWLTWSGWAVALACLFGVVFFPLILFALWILAVGVSGLRSAGR
jgi:hypothetical protein